MWKILTSAIRLRCPRCLRSPLFRGPFSMNRDCPACGLVFEREPGYWIGSIYLNYGVTVALMLGLWFGLETFTAVGTAARLSVCAAAGVGVPLVCFRHARALWMAVDRAFDPSEPDRPEPRRPGAA